MEMLEAAGAGLPGALRDAYERGGAEGTAREIAGHTYVVLPDGWRRASLDEAIEKLAPHPRRKRGKVQLTAPGSFIDYLGRHAQAGATTVYVNPDTGTFTGVIDDHSAGEAGWAEHRAAYALKATRAWAAWQSLSTKMVGQEEFADFLEDRLGEIAEPDGAVLFDVVTNLRVNTHVAFRSAVQRSSGRVKLAYEEDGDQGGGKAGDIAIPETITVQCVAYEGMEEVRVTARFRFRVGPSGAFFGYDLDEAIARVREEAVVATADRFAASLEGVLFVYGTRGS